MSGELCERISQAQVRAGEQMVMENLAALGFGTAPVVDQDAEFRAVAIRVIRESHAEHGDPAVVAAKVGCSMGLVRAVVGLEEE